MNNANFSGASAIYISDIDGDGNDIGAAVLADMLFGKRFRFTDPSVPGDDWIFSITSATPTDNTTYWALGIDLVSGEVFPSIPNSTPMTVLLSDDTVVVPPASTTTFGQIPYLDEGRYKGSGSTIIIDPRNGVANGRIQSVATLAGQPQGAMCVMYGASGAQAMWYHEGATANEGSYAMGRTNLGLGNDEFEWGLR